MAGLAKVKRQGEKQPERGAYAAAEAVLEARRIAEQVAEQLLNAEAMFMAAAKAAGLESVEVGDHRLTPYDGVRRTWVSATEASAVLEGDAERLDAITELKVVAKRVDAAAEVGLLDNETVRRLVKQATPYSGVRVSKV